MRPGDTVDQGLGGAPGGVERVDLEAERRARRAQRARLGIRGLPLRERDHVPCRRHRVAQRPREPAHRVVEVAEETGEVAAGPRQARHQAARDRIVHEIDGDDRDGVGGVARGPRRHVVAGDDDADGKRGELAGGRAPAIGAGAAAQDEDVLSDVPRRVAQPLHEDRGERNVVGEKADARDRRPGRARAGGQPGGEAGDERAPLDQASSRSSRSSEPSSRRLISSRVAR